ncbi:hypothetical protein PO909_001090, partial [Leuciscus waleckii]
SLYTGFQNSATNRALFVQQQPLQARDLKLKSNQTAHFIAGHLGQKSTHWSKNIPLCRARFE